MEIVKTYIVKNVGDYYVYPKHNEYVKIHELADGTFISENNKGDLKDMYPPQIKSLLNK